MSWGFDNTDIDYLWVGGVGLVDGVGVQINIHVKPNVGLIVIKLSLNWGFDK